MYIVPFFQGMPLTCRTWAIVVDTGVVAFVTWCSDGKELVTGNRYNCTGREMATETEREREKKEREKEGKKERTRSRDKFNVKKNLKRRERKKEPEGEISSM